jgi:hypothetical protein
MKILFVFLSPLYLRNYESTLKILAERGIQIKLRFHSLENNDLLQQKLSSENSNITYSHELLPKRQDKWASLIKFVRTINDYLGYFNLDYVRLNKPKDRIEKRLGFILTTSLKGIQFFFKLSGIKQVEKVIKQIEKAIPSDPKLSKIILEENADLVLITPLINFSFVQTDYLKSAKNLSINCGVCVHSWDNLTTKGKIQIEPYRLFVWNHIQQKEAIEIHNISPSKIVVAGAQCYDRWFERKPTTQPEEFKQKIGFSSNSSYILYLCSSGYFMPEEVEFVREWIQKLRTSDNPLIQQISILIRPHHQYAEQWQTVDLSQWKNVVIWPKNGENPVTLESSNNFYDSIYHSTAVMGINTSAMIEAGILNKPVYTILDPRFQDVQTDTIHFHYLVKGGLIQSSENFNEHLQQLSAMLKGGGQEYREQIQHFICNFVRPYGLDVPCTPILANAIEEMLYTQPIPSENLSIWTLLLRLGLLPVASLLQILEYFYKKSSRFE